MPNLVVRVTGSEMAALEAAASRSGQSKSDYVREALALRESGPEYARLLESHERRLSALESIARRQTTREGVPHANPSSRSTATH